MQHSLGSYALILVLSCAVLSCAGATSQAGLRRLNVGQQVSRVAPLQQAALSAGEPCSAVPHAPFGQATSPTEDPVAPKWPLATTAAGDSQAPFNAALPTIWIVGDSTASFHGEDPKEGELSTQGWGPFLSRYFDLSRINIVNAARGGRSSRTYMTEGLWARVCSLMKPRDIVLIQLGQNDVFPVNDATRARGTLRGTGDESEAIENLLTKQHEVVHTFGWYIRQYVRDTRSRGAIPVVLSVTPRDMWLPDGHMERGAPNYRAWAQSVAESENHASFVDIASAIAMECEKIGKAETARLYHDGEPVHFNTIGARKFTAWTVRALETAYPRLFTPYRNGTSAILAQAQQRTGSPAHRH